jgi:methylated-DNA-protein-cysteine methyltransferase-like protein
MTAMVTQNQNKDILEIIFDVVRMIPKGRVTSYGAIAQSIGIKKSARLVGWAMNQSHQYPNIPAHRVVNHQGLLTGKHHFETPSTMQQLLESEGIKVTNDKVTDFKNIFWNPQTEIQL